MSDAADAKPNPYPYGATIREPQNWEEKALINHHTRNQQSVKDAWDRFIVAQKREQKTARQLHARGMLTANPPPAK